MKIWNSENAIPMDGYSIAENLLFAVVSETPKSELLPFEKLYVALKSNRACHTDSLTDVYMECGCFDKAKEAYAATSHHRKLGDICWIQGDLDGAEQHYLTPTSGAQSYRTKPDFDRLIKLAFYREQWDRVIQRFVDASFTSSFSEGRVCCGNSEVAARPFLEILTISLDRLKRVLPPNVQSILTSAFGLSPESWNILSSDKTYEQETTVEKIKKRCPPQLNKSPLLTTDEALDRGCTSRANDILTYINQCDALLDEAQDHLENFGTKGDEGSLHQFRNRDAFWHHIGQPFISLLRNGAR